MANSAIAQHARKTCNMQLDDKHAAKMSLLAGDTGINELDAGENVENEPICNV